jgi:predicted dehydrogenase
MSIHCLVIGVGKMGSAHLAALAALSPDSLTAWAPGSRPRAIEREVGGVAVRRDELAKTLAAVRPTHVVVASPVETLAPIAVEVMKAGVKHLLIEKPAAMDQRECRLLLACASETGAEIYVAYNRRFYASVRCALEHMRAAGERIESVMFEFNEAMPAQGPGSASDVAARWLLANSMHVIDTAFHPVGPPDMQRSLFHRRGGLSWHPAGSIFVGSGETTRGIPFAFHANWDAPGRWGFEWMTKSTRYVFRPIEKLSVMRRGRFDLEPMALDDEIDTRFKPGVYHQNAAFLAGDKMAGLMPLSEAAELIPLAQKIAGYPED